MTNSKIYLIAFVINIQAIVLWSTANAQNTYHKCIQVASSLNTFADDGVCDNNRNLYVVGGYGNSVNQMFVAKLNNAGTMMWIKTYFDCDPINIIWNADSTFTILCQSEILQNSANGTDLLIVRMDTTGTILQTKLFYNATREDGSIEKLNNGNFLISGLLRDSNNNFLNFMYLLDANYDVLTARQYDDFYWIGSGPFCIDNAGSLYSCGFIGDGSQYSNTRITKFDGLGNEIVTIEMVYGGYNGIYNCVHANNKIYALGYRYIATPQGIKSHNFVVCLDTGLNIVWSKSIHNLQGTGGGLVRIYDVPSDSALILHSSAGFYKIDYNGNVMDYLRINGVGQFAEISMVIDKLGSFYFLGSHLKLATQQPYIAKADSTFRTHCFEGQFAPTYDSIILPISINNISITKNNLSYVEYDTLFFGSVSSPIIDTTYCDVSVSLQNDLKGLRINPTVFPNPFDESINVETHEYIAVEIFSITMQHIAKFPLSIAKRNEINLSHLNKGIYILVFKSHIHSYYFKIIKQ